MRPQNVALAALGCLTLAAPAMAGVVLYDLDGGQDAAWRSFLTDSHKTPVGGWDFDLDPDYGVVAFDGPLSSLGAGPVSPGVISNDNISIPGQLMAIGRSAPFQNPSNAVLSSDTIGGLEIDLPALGAKAIEFDVISILALNRVDITVTTTFGIHQFEGVHAPSRGHQYAFTVDGALKDETITSVLIFNSAGGYEGIQGRGIIYIPAVPTGLAFAACGLLRRRSRAS